MFRKPNPVQFSFSTNGEYHPSGLGAWALYLEQTGNLSATWKRAGQATKYGPFQLGREDNERVWGLIEQANFSNLSSSPRLGTPDEILYSFAFHLDNQVQTIQLWAGDMHTLSPAQALILEIKGLIQRYTGQNAYL